jgi:secreted protein with Ig-like and vWFA domain
MNEEPHHLSPVGDEALEARIIAWVLGEASPFEAAELENICEQNPEWRVFQRRMLAIHELLGEATTTGAAEDWKMPSEKRGKLDAVIGGVEVTKAKPQRKPETWWQRVAGLAAVLAIVTLVGSLATTSLNQSKRSKDIIAYQDTDSIVTYSANKEVQSITRKPSAPSAKMNAATAPSIVEMPVPETDAPQPSADYGDGSEFGEGWGSGGEGEGSGGSASSRTEFYDSRAESGKALQKGKSQSITRSGAAPSIEVIREFVYPNEYEPPELPNAPADPFADESQPEVATSFNRLTPAKEEATRLREGERVPMLDEIPGVGKLFSQKPSAPAASNAQVIAGASTGVQLEKHVMGYAKVAEGDEVASALRNAPVTDSSKESVQFNGRNFDVQEAPPASSSVDSIPGSSLAERTTIRRGVVRSGESAEGGARDSSISDDPIRSNPAIVYEEAKTVDQVRRSLYTGEGQYNLGKFDDAQREFEGILQIDPDNKAARRWLERVNQSKTDYYRSAYDHTRAELLTDVDKKWELTIPDNGKDVDPLASELSPLTRPPAVDQDRYAWWSGAENQKAAVTSGNRVDIDGNQSTTDKVIRREVIDEKEQASKELEEINGQLAKPNLQAPAEKKNEAPLTLPEIFASQEPYSTFSLRVSDNAFRIAQAAMAQNQRPAAESVRVEEFYNAFDYGDPVPTAQEPVAASMEQSAHPILPQRNLLRIGLRTAAAGRGAGQPLHLTLLVDQSGSMSRGDRSDALLASVKELSTLLNAQDQISVIGFSRTPRLLAEKVPGDQQARLIELLARTPSDGGTNLEEALKLGEVVAKRNHLAGAQNRLLLLTDGAANLGNADPDRLAAWVKTLRQQNIAFDIAGIGTDGLNDPLLVEIARNGNGRYYVMNNAAQAKQQFAAQLAGAFRPAAENVKVQVQFNPQRVGKYQLIGFEKDRLRTEDFRNDKVDAAEMAAAEAGQALYQIELLPEGTGDVGEVSVRFRDVATQQMVERKWTIRYDPTTPAFDNATPTMQLAGLAMLSAQKLQGGADAPMIRFSEMQEPLRNVRDEFSSNQRVGELLEMIQKLND